MVELNERPSSSPSMGFLLQETLPELVSNYRNDQSIRVPHLLFTLCDFKVNEQCFYSAYIFCRTRFPNVRRSWRTMNYRQLIFGALVTPRNLWGLLNINTNEDRTDSYGDRYSTILILCVWPKSSTGPQILLYPGLGPVELNGGPRTKE